MKLGAEGQRVGGAVSWSRADGANPFCSGLHGYGWTFVETILFTPEEETAAGGFRNEWQGDSSEYVYVLYMSINIQYRLSFYLTCWGCVSWYQLH